MAKAEIKVEVDMTDEALQYLMGLEARVRDLETTAGLHDMRIVRLAGERFGTETLIEKPLLVDCLAQLPEGELAGILADVKRRRG